MAIFKNHSTLKPFNHTKVKTFFIAGVQRSGTTLLSVLLGNHPEVEIDGYSKAFRLISLLNNYEKVLPLNLQHPEDEVLRWKIENDYKGRLSEFLDLENFESYPNFRAMVHASVEKRLDEKQAQIWGDKSPNLQFYLSDIQLLFPDTKIIHIVRDGRATALSNSKRAYQNILLAAKDWVDGNVVGFVNQKLIGTDRYLILKYEDLLSEPESTARRLCDFLEIPFDSKMLEMEEGATDDSYVKSTFDTSKINQFKKEISPSTLRKIERIQGPLLKKMGYELQFPELIDQARPMSLRQWLWLRQGDNFKMLFRSKRMGMVNRKNVEIPISLRNRLSKFMFNLGHDFLPKMMYEKLFQRVYNKDRYYKK